MPKETPASSSAASSGAASSSTTSTDAEKPDKESAASLAVAKPFAVKIFTTGKDYDYSEPWKAPSIQKWTGSGFAISGNQIVTNAHVAGGSIFIEVQVANDSKKYKARVKEVGHECDLAILEVDDPEFWEKVNPAPIGNTPDRREKVEVHGFPMGGKEYCITKGIVSRSERDYYAHSEEQLLSTQVDAPINPGNSGGAVINKKGEVVGVAFQGLRGGQNIGYMIPAGVLKHFLTQVSSDSLGFPGLAINVQPMENEYLRKRFRMRKSHTGIMVTDVALLSCALGHLREGDVLLEINDHKIQNDGSVNVSPMKKVDWQFIVNNSRIGDNVTFKVLRNGRERFEKVTLTNKISSLDVIGPLEFGKPPTYFMVGGIVGVQPVNKNFLKDTQMRCPNRQKRVPDEQLLVINTVINSEYSQGYDGFRGEIVESVNGHIIHNMNDLVEAVDNHKGKRHEIVTHSGRHIVVPNLSAAAISSLLEPYGIPSDRSVDLVKKEAANALDEILGLDSQPLLFSEGSSAQAARSKTPPPVARDPNQSDDEDDWDDMNEDDLDDDLDDGLAASGLSHQPAKHDSAPPRLG